MKTFGTFIEDGGMGGAPATSTAGVAGAGDNPQKIVPVGKEAQKRIRNRGMLDTNAMINQYMFLARKTV